MWKSLKDAKINPNSRVLVRADLDVLDDRGVLKDEYRLKRSLPTLQFIIDQGGLPVICGHIGQPHGDYIEELSTKSLKPFFDNSLGKNKYILLENLRFDIGEEQNEDFFASRICSEGNLYVNDSFSTMHRKHASMVSFAKKLESFYGLNVQEELLNLDKILENSRKPFIAIVGGKKLESKLPAIKRLINFCDFVLVGNLLTDEWLKEHLPVPTNMILSKDSIEGKDIGEVTTVEFCDILSVAGSVLWAGPLGMFENDKYMTGTQKVCSAIIDSGAFCIAGGGDTVSAINKLNLGDKFSFLSTGGGAMLKYIAGENLPGLESLGFYEKTTKSSL